jgi:hypothetical protein
VTQVIKWQLEPTSRFFLSMFWFNKNFVFGYRNKDAWTRTAQPQMSTCLVSFKQPILFLRQLKRGDKLVNIFLVLFPVQWSLIETWDLATLFNIFTKQRHQLMFRLGPVLFLNTMIFIEKCLRGNQAERNWYWTIPLSMKKIIYIDKILSVW